MTLFSSWYYQIGPHLYFMEILVISKKDIHREMRKNEAVSLINTI